ncbi:DUF4124 domain-containing protein [Marinobacter psychrophilus]|jgi:hypothetical protein|uniref:DUF4124 domain-containing protein n=1 Tax=Marinobacter psychrophilus TaxID=330734 RepID=UPI001B45B9EE|nr:DUF4124 domain-containing protein [Marinobacter psychrophilus]MBQ0762061.1 DUF4124 domain-containing protein [Marinobacter psychrophilus]MBQ0844490.1 DUF4124 domain-containing protein [Marinobacter psychrophilus]
MTIQLKTMALLLAMVPAMANATVVYKWTDADGVTHFGDRQPTGTQAEQISVKSGQSNLVNSNSSAQQQLNELEQRQRAASEESRAFDAAATRQAQRKTNCDAAQQNLEIISNNSRIRITENGEQRFLTPDEVSQQKQTYEDIVEQDCGAEQAP